tara:strand:- start:14 stop:271 length:258 start_codon:yes stop_codon:yes gene_type:complete
MKKREKKMTKYIEDINSIGFNELKVNMNYETGTRGENSCRIVSKGSELDQMYARTYHEYLKKTREERIRKEKEPMRDGAGEWILS